MSIWNADEAAEKCQFLPAQPFELSHQNGKKVPIVVD